jgi:ribonuclease-3
MFVRRENCELEKTIQYYFRNKSLLVNALTHSSYSNEQKSKCADIISNERLEFLGDSILQIIVSEYLYNNFPNNNEGFLTKSRQGLVCESALASAARRISLGDYLYLGKGDSSNNSRDRDSLLADAFEALIAAVYIDSGENGMKNTHKIVHNLMQNEFRLCHSKLSVDYKTRLQQLVQQGGNEILDYETVSESGPAHDRVFEVNAKINSNIVGKGVGHTRREAEQRAAHEALLWFGVKDLYNE